MAYEEDDIFKYLSYVTLREGWACLKGFFGVWLMFTVFVMGGSAFLEFGVSKTEAFWSILPNPVWYLLAFAAFAWFMRGEESRMVFVWPKTFKPWLLLTAFAALIFFTFTFLPTWAVAPGAIAIFCGTHALAILAEIYKKNFQKLSGRSSNSS